MKNVLILLKNDLIRFFGSLQGKKTRKKTSIMIFFCTLAYLGICAVFALQVYGLFISMINVKEIPIFNSFQIVFMLLILTAFQTLSGKSKTSDSDFLLSLPLNKHEIVLAKTLSKYLFCLFLASMIVLPTLVLYSVIIELSVSVILWGVFLLLMLPLFSIGINYFVNFLLVCLFNKIKHAGIVKTIFAILLFGGLIAIYIYNSIVMGTMTIETIDDYLNSNFLIGWCVRLLVHNNVIALLYLCLVVFGVFAFGVVAYSFVFGKTFMKYDTSSTKIKYSNSGSYNTLQKKEIKKYFSTPILIFNTIIAPILLIALTIFIIIKGNGIFNIFGMVLDRQTFYAIITLMFLFMCSTTLVSPVLISLEGKNLWILKSTPVNIRHILLSKSFVNIIIFIPTHLVCSLSILILFGGNLSEWLLFILLPILLNIIISFGGTYINLLFPKFDFDNETQVVKSSLSVFVAMLLGIILAIIPILFNFLNISINIIGYITLGIYLVLSILCLSLLMTDGVKKFNKLNC